MMTTVTLSSKFQVTIPPEIRKALDLTPGQKFQLFVCRNRIEMIPLKPISTLRGFLHGIDTTVEREDDRF